MIHRRKAGRAAAAVLAACLLFPPAGRTCSRHRPRNARPLCMPMWISVRWSTHVPIWTR